MKNLRLCCVLGFYLGCLWGSPLIVLGFLQRPWDEVWLGAGMPLLALTAYWLSNLPALSQLLKGMLLGVLLAPLGVAALCVWRGGGLLLLGAQLLSALLLGLVPWPDSLRPVEEELAKS